MTPKEWAIQAFETCEHAGMICMSCAERAISAAIEEDRAQALCDSHAHNGDEELLRQRLSSPLAPSEEA